MNSPQRKLGVRGPSPRGKFETFKAARPPQHLPSSISYEYGLPNVWDQGDASDCVANASMADAMFYFHKRRGQWFDLSRAATYVAGKLKYEDADMSTPGMYPVSALELIRDMGACYEKDFPSNDADLSDTAGVPDNLWHPEFRINDFVEVNNDVLSLKQAMHEAGPIVIAVDWQNAWFTPDAKGFLPAADYSAGGHSILIVAYDDAHEAFKIRNSWGSGWGLSGYAWWPYSLVNPFLMNAYTVKVVA